MSLSYFFDLFTTTGAVILIIATAVIFIASYSSNPNLKKITDFFVKYSKWLILGASSMAIVGSLIYSDILKFEPCLLCWWQRIFIYPVFIIALVSIIKKDKNPFQYINPLMWLALVTSLYHNYLIVVAGKTDSFFCDPATAGACSDRYVEVLSVIDIPFMALSIILFILILSLISLKDLNKTN
jgi:disulfide bond formation protein DsbB